MKKLLIIVFCFVCSWVYAQNNPGSIDVSFVFNRQNGFSTNQYALWIEDSQGNLVKTLYATKFTATGGWAKRPESIPLWVSKSGLSTMAKNDIDAFTGATPRTGTMNYRWDGTDKNGKPLGPGEYKVFLEATLRGENRVLFSASVSLGSHVETEAKPVYFGSGTKERGMIENVKLVYRP